MNIQKPRILSLCFEEALLSGILQPILKLVQQDRDLIAEIRTDRLDVYCKGQRLISITIMPDRKHYKFESDKAFWLEQSKFFEHGEDVDAFCCDLVPRIKQKIAMHHMTGMEIEFEQMLIRSNNLEALNTDYIAIDRQGRTEDGNGRTDIVGVFWPGEQRRSIEKLAPALIEVKYGLHGGIEGIADQIKGYFDDLNKELSGFADALEGQLRQKARLGLLAGLSKEAQDKIQRLPISKKIDDVRVVIALVDYNPRAKRFDKEQLFKLPFASQIDLFHLGFGMWQARAHRLDGVPP
jgi:hypothetical protein